MSGSTDKAFTYNIDVLASCNLSCPSCPVGNMPGLPAPASRMSPEAFEEILLKIKRETPGTTQIGLYNWAEPILHPELPKLLAIARKHQMPVALSCNFNSSRNLEAILREEPMSFRVSVSGFHQKTYERTHQKGDIEKVKTHLRELRETMDRLKSKTQVQVAYHCYIDNLGDDYTQMRAFCAELGFFFLPMWAYFMPIEKLLTVFEGKDLSEQDQGVLRLLAVTPHEARDVARLRKSPDCTLRSHQTAINSDGSVALCCGVYDRKHNIAPKFVDATFDELQAAKYQHALCRRCMHNGIHDLVTYTDFDAWNRIASAKILPQKLPKELRRLGMFYSLRRKVSKVLGHSTWDRMVHVARLVTFRKRRRSVRPAEQPPVQ